MYRILFVCLGNICRSPAAEGVMKKIILNNDLESIVTIDSAGTSAYHAGSSADSRMQNHAADRGYILESISRQFRAKDFLNFDLILAMDLNNLKDIQELASQNELTLKTSLQKIKLFTDFCEIHPKLQGVPDPYYGGANGFEYVMDIVEDGCQGILKWIRPKLKEKK